MRCRALSVEPGRKAVLRWGHLRRVIEMMISNIIRLIPVHCDDVVAVKAARLVNVEA